MALADIGWRAIAANISDLAAMGARPLLATVALGVPVAMSQSDILELYRGMLEIATAHGCGIAGGDVVRAPELFVSITAIGEVRASQIKGRAGACAGDIAAVTGSLGASRAGLEISENPRKERDEELRAQALQAHRRPQPRVAEGEWLAASRNVHAMMDISDGLSSDLARICAQSRCAAVIESVPVAWSASQMAKQCGEDPQSYALASGEEYELLVAVSARAFTYVSTRFSKRFGRPLLPVGRFREGTGVYVLKGGREESLVPTGWDHFS